MRSTLGNTAEALRAELVQLRAQRDEAQAQLRATSPVADLRAAHLRSAHSQLNLRGAELDTAHDDIKHLRAELVAERARGYTDGLAAATRNLVTMLAQRP